MNIRRYEYQDDKYGQCHRAVCSCGIASNWQQSREIAKHTLIQEHQYWDGCAAKKGEYWVE